MLSKLRPVLAEFGIANEKNFTCFSENCEKAIDNSVLFCYNICVVKQRGVAQFGRALGSGPRGRKFKSSHSDQNQSKCSKVLSVSAFFMLFWG